MGRGARVPGARFRGRLRSLDPPAALRGRHRGRLRLLPQRATGMNRRYRMARDFEDHCWKYIVDEETLEIYEPYRREVRVGRNPALLAIDLYNKAYQGGNLPVREVNRRYSGSCGEHAWRALEPTQALLAAAR